MIETSNPNGLMRLGWSKRSLKPGDEITVEAYRAKDGSNTANAATGHACGRPQGVRGFVRHAVGHAVQQRRRNDEASVVRRAR